MGLNRWWILTGLIIMFVFCGACSDSQTNITPNVTEPPAVIRTPVPTVPLTPTETRTQATFVVPTPTPEPTLEAIEPDWTVPPVVYPKAETDTTKILFTQYKSDDFMAEYPGTWSAENMSFQMEDTQLYKEDFYSREARAVAFTSEDGNVSMRVIVYDFLHPGRYTLTPTIDAARRDVANRFPDANGTPAVLNYLYAENEQRIMVATYDVIIPETSRYYPYAYTEQTWLTYNHRFVVDFIVLTGNLEEYRALKYRMMKSIVTEGNQMRRWW